MAYMFTFDDAHNSEFCTVSSTPQQGVIDVAKHYAGLDDVVCNEIGQYESWPACIAAYNTRVVNQNHKIKMVHQSDLLWSRWQ